MGWKGYLGAMLLSNFVMLLLMYAILRGRNTYRSIPMHRQYAACSGVQHRRIVHYEYELAVLQRREQLILPSPDGGNYVSDVHIGSYRVCRCNRLYPRADRQAGFPGQFLCGYDSGHHSGVSSAQLYRCLVSRIPRSAADDSRSDNSNDTGRRQADDNEGAGRISESIKHLGTNGGGGSARMLRIHSRIRLRSPISWIFSA